MSLIFHHQKCSGRVKVVSALSPIRVVASRVEKMRKLRIASVSCDGALDIMRTAGTAEIVLLADMVVVHMSVVALLLHQFLDYY